ncbi:MAG TPA: MSMEG_0567/Sll0786 family nitrogen starvation N-acetyltransferase [Mycobacteriales bacterium]|jgi:putative N-acetyltransferase (TIGR04045 family)|nr:MSMEG_0567/Sll0786 family nitrogen starvation N-acetyltransferase [Mycobacteriales bacterium]
MTDVLSSPCSSPEQAGRPVCRPVLDAAELAEHHRIRHEVFVREQRLFPGDDVDEHDSQGSTVHVLGLVDGCPSGTVRLYPVDDSGLWKGDRLAVLPGHRRSQLGRPLVRLAVALAGARGGTRMVASVQAPNRRFFVTLGWTPVGEPFDLLGQPHQQMTIPLAP